MSVASAIRLVLDQGVPRESAAALRNLGYECLHVGEVGMAKATDEAILAFALLRHAIVVTLDADFHTILAVAGASGPSVIRVRMQGLGGPEVVKLVQNVLAGFPDDLKRGSLVTVKAHDHVSPVTDWQFRVMCPLARALAGE